MKADIGLQVGIETLVSETDPTKRVYRAVIVAILPSTGQVVQTLGGPIREQQSEAEADVTSISETIQKNAAEMGIQCEEKPVTQGSPLANAPALDDFDKTDAQDFHVHSSTVH